MGSKFRVGDRVSWSSEAGRVAGIITKEIIAPTFFEGYMRHASKEEPQYFIKSERSITWRSIRRLP